MKPTFKALVERLKAMDHATVKVGVLSDAGTAPDGTPLVDIAAVHEFGNRAGTIPQRSFIRSTFRRTTNDRNQLVAKVIKQVLNDNSMTVDKALGVLGQWGAAQIKNTIVKRLTEGPEAQELKPATIVRKGSSTPLIDTGQLKNSISYAIVNK